MKKAALVLLFIVCCSSLAFAQTDQLTLTTYYPAPFGMYQEMRVMGKLGVGTTDPQHDLHVKGNKAETLARIDNAANPAASPWSLHVSNSHSASPSTFSGGALKASTLTSNAFSIYSDTGRNYFGGLVGVGTTDPAQQIDVSGPAGGFLALTRADPSVAPNDVLGAISFRAIDGNFDGARIEAQSAGIWASDAETRLRFLTTNSGLTTPEERMRIEPNGIIGIGTTLPVATLHVANTPILAPYPLKVEQAANQSGSWTALLSQGTTMGSPSGKGGIYMDIADTSYGVYQTSAGDLTKNYFKGAMGIGTTNPVDIASSMLYVDSPSAATQDGVIRARNFVYDVHIGRYQPSPTLHYGVDINQAFNGGGAGLRVNVMSNSRAATFMGGNVGIGTTNPVDTLDVNGQMRVRYTLSSGIFAPMWESGECTTNHDGLIVYGAISYPQPGGGGLSVGTTLGVCMCQHTYGSVTPQTPCKWTRLDNP